MIDPDSGSIHTGSGTAITGGGDFIGRDKIIVRSPGAGAHGALGRPARHS